MGWGPGPESAGTAGDAARWGGSRAVVGMAADPLVPTRPAAMGPAEQWKRARHGDSAGHAFRRERIGPSPP